MVQTWVLPLDLPYRVVPGKPVTLRVGTWPIEFGQSVQVNYKIVHVDKPAEKGHLEADWQYNEGSNSYWRAELGPFLKGDQITCTIQARSPQGEVSPDSVISFRAGPRLYLAFLWHQHQPIYKNMNYSTPQGSYLQPWVRLHAIRDYYSMAALAQEHPAIHLSINLTPALLWQLEDYLKHGASDRALDLTLKPAAELTPQEQEEILGTFFEAHWHNQIFPHPRYKELFLQRLERQPFSIQDLRDLQMWFNLAWFGKEFRDGEVRLLATGETTSVRPFVRQGRNFTGGQIREMVGEQYKLMRAIVPAHRLLQEQGQLEISTTPFYHPILPLLIDTDQATLDRPGAAHPSRFAYPEDAEAQVNMAVELYRRLFGQAPGGMWPAEGAVSQSVIPFFSRHNIKWIASDRGVLARSGRWGYRVADADVLCRAYRAEEGENSLSIFFRDTALSDEIGFHYQDYTDYDLAAKNFICQIRRNFVRRVSVEADCLLTVVLDGENAWGAYPEDARPFLHALYHQLEQETELETVTFSEYIEGNPPRAIPPHPLKEQTRVHELFSGSWIDENGSLPGVDLGTWIGEVEENRAWELLKQTREFMNDKKATPQNAPEAYQSLYIAEGSDWFWWFGEDQDSGNDAEFDDLFRLHLKNIYRALKTAPPASLDEHLVSHGVVWTFTRPIETIQPGDRLVIVTNCPGTLNWRLDGKPSQEANMYAVGGGMAGVQRYQLTLGPFPPQSQELRFIFHCTHPGCTGQELCCNPGEIFIGITSSKTAEEEQPPKLAKRKFGVTRSRTASLAAGKN